MLNSRNLNLVGLESLQEKSLYIVNSNGVSSFASFLSSLSRLIGNHMETWVKGSLKVGILPVSWA